MTQANNDPRPDRMRLPEDMTSHELAQILLSYEDLPLSFNAELNEIVRMEDDGEEFWKAYVY